MKALENILLVECNKMIINFNVKNIFFSKFVESRNTNKPMFSFLFHFELNEHYRKDDIVLTLPF